MTSLGEIGSRVRNVRRERGMRQVDLAALAGISRYTLIKLERGQLADVMYKTLLAILAPLGLELRVEAGRPTGLPVLGESE